MKNLSFIDEILEKFEFSWKEIRKMGLLGNLHGLFIDELALCMSKITKGRGN